MLILASVTAAGGHEFESSVFATWRDGGSVTCGEFETWLGERGGALDSPTVRPLLERYASTHVLAAAATERGMGTTALDRAIRRQREDLLYAALLQKAVVGAVSVSDEELDALEAKYPEAFVRPRKVRLFNLFKRTLENAPAGKRRELRREMAVLRARAQKGEDFSALAREHSESETRLRGGLVGMVEAGDLPSAVEAEVMALAEGAVSRVLESADGFQIFFVERVLPERRPTPEERRSKLEGNLRKKKTDEAWEAVKVGVVESANLRFFPERRETPGAVLVSGENLELTTLDLEADLAEVPVRGSFGTNAARVRLEYLAETRLLAGEARRRGIAPSESELRSMEDRWNERLALLELARRVQGAITRPSEEEVAGYFKEHAEDFELPREFELWAVRISFDRDDHVAQRAAEEALRLAAEQVRQDPATFRHVAQRLSDLGELAPSGYLGWVGPRRLFVLSPNVRKAVEGLAEGEVSEPIREGDSYWLVRLSDLRSPRIPTLAEVYDRVEDRVGQIRADAARAAIEEALLVELAVEIQGECGGQISSAEQ